MVVIRNVAVISRVLVLVVGILAITRVQAGTLPPDSVDSMYHRYEGGGMVIDGPSILVRKSVGPQVSLIGHYYVDSVSSASVDVVATASEYTEERTEVSAGMDYLHDKSLLSIGYTHSDENDFQAKTVNFSVSQDFFGDLSTLTLGYVRGWDQVGMVESDFAQEVERQNFQIGFNQVLTKNTLLGLNFELITDEGFLNNPYRRVRYLDPTELEQGYRYQPELYPDTHTSNALALRVLYYLPYRASIKAEYRYFSDSWGITAHTYELGYVQPLATHWEVEARLRRYQQTQADFYSDLFPFENAQTHLARDKELSTFSDQTIGAGVSYRFDQGAVQSMVPGIEQLRFSLLLDYLTFRYDNFRDVTQSGYSAGNEPLYQYHAWVTRASITLLY